MLQAREVRAKILRLETGVEVDLVWLGKVETSLAREAQVRGRPVGTRY